jgi:RNA polymerase sigma-70 factor, ECF subfamily
MAYPEVETSDEELVARCKVELPHNSQSYERLIQRHMNHVYRTVYRIIGNQEDAEEVAQDVFLKVHNHIKKFEQQSSFSTWLYRIAVNSALDALDKKKRRMSKGMYTSEQGDKKQTDQRDQEELSHPSPEDPEEKILQKELRECINSVFRKLEREQAEVLVMHDLDELSYDEISHIMDAGLSAVKMRIHRARLAFQKVFLQICDKAQLAFSVTTQQKIPSQQKKGG